MRHAVALGGGGHLRIVRVQQQPAHRLHQVFRARRLRRLGDGVEVVEHDADGADAADAGLRADRRPPVLRHRVAEDALLRLAGEVVEVDLLVRTTGDTEAPAAALVLVHEHDAVLRPLVQRPRGARGDARGVEAVVADPREVEHEDLLVAAHHLGLELPERRVVGLQAPGQVVVPVGTPAQVDGPAGELRAWRDRGRRRLRRRRDEVLVVVGPRLVVVVDDRHVEVAEDGDQLLHAAAGAQREAAAAVERPAALPALLVLPAPRVSGPRPGLDVVPPHVLGAVPVGPGLLAGDGAGMAADALVERHHHHELCVDGHQ